MKCCLPGGEACLPIGFWHMHADDVEEVIAEGRDEAADEGGVQEEGGRLCGMRHQHVEAEHAQLEDGVVVSGAHVGQRQHDQHLGEELAQIASMHCLQVRASYSPLPPSWLNITSSHFNWTQQAE